MLWNFAQFRNNTALISDEGFAMTYGELISENDALAEVIGRRCLVFSLCSNTVGSVIGYTAFLQNQIVPVLLNAHLDPLLLENLIQTYHPAYVWAPVGTAVSAGQDAFQAVYTRHGYALLKTAYEDEFSLNEQLGLLLTTSGSTGSPKLVRQTYRNVLFNAEQIAEYLHLDSSERPITTLPMNYTYGCSIVNSHLLVGASLLLTERTLMDRGFWSFLREQRATSFGGVPYTYEMLEKLRFSRMDLPSLRYMTQAGGKLAPELHKKFAEYALAKGKKFVVMYGACEATARMGYLPAEYALEKYGSCGIAIPRGRFYLEGADGSIIHEANVAGELVYEGENVTMGYAENGSDLIKGDERGGILHTGDMARVDEEGFYYIVGRKKRFLKIYGNRVNLDEIDRLIKSEFDYLDCASAGTDDNMYIFVTDASAADAVRRFVSDRIRLNLSAIHVVTISAIPRNEAGKTLYRELAAYYQ